MGAAVRGGARSQSKPRNTSASRSAGRPAPARSVKGQAARRGFGPATAVLAGALVAAGALAASLMLDTPVRRGVSRAIAAADRRLADAGLRVATLSVQGAGPEADADIRQASGVAAETPILHVDLADVRRRVEQVGWVKSARVVRLLPGTIVIAVTERTTYAVWQHAGSTHVIDDTGRVIPEADPGRYGSLPFVVGEGADAAAPAMLQAMRAYPDLLGRAGAFVRVDDRRWDIRMKDGGVIELPAGGEADALARLEALDQKSRILSLGFARIDLRDPEVIAVRPREAPTGSQIVANGA